MCRRSKSCVRPSSSRPDLDPHFVVLEHGHHQPDIEPRFVVIRRGRRRHERSEAVDTVTLDGDVMHREAFFERWLSRQGDCMRKRRRSNQERLRQWLRLRARRRLKEGRLILVAEDNEINQKVIRQQLTFAGICSRYRQRWPRSAEAMGKRRLRLAAY